MNNPDFDETQVKILMPSLNESENLSILFSELRKVLGDSKIPYSILVTDDGSRAEELERIRVLMKKYPEVDLLVGNFKSGHQSAILRGLCHLIEEEIKAPWIVIMDSDGEDKPEHIAVLLNKIQEARVNAVLAKRGVRQSGFKFLLMHRLFNVPFRLLTGKKLETGNFMILSSEWVSTLIKLPSVTNHVSATVLRFSPSTESITLDRGKRYSGTSRMNLASLSLHGYGALAVYADIALSRLVISIGLLGGFLLLISSSLIATKIFMGVHFLPGWTSSAVLQLMSLTLITVIQALTTTILILWTKKS